MVGCEPSAMSTAPGAAELCRLVVGAAFADGRWSDEMTVLAARVLIES
jgi:hypothetical protein